MNGLTSGGNLEIELIQDSTQSPRQLSVKISDNNIYSEHQNYINTKKEL